MRFMYSNVDRRQTSSMSVSDALISRKLATSRTVFRRSFFIALNESTSTFPRWRAAQYPAPLAAHEPLMKKCPDRNIRYHVSNLGIADPYTASRTKKYLETN